MNFHAKDDKTFPYSRTCIQPGGTMGIRRVAEIDDRVAVKTTLISVFDKTGLDTFIPGLVSLIPDIEIISTGGTYSHIKEILGPGRGNNLVNISSYTGQPEMEGGLVKTLDYKIYLGILSERYNASHGSDLLRANAKPIDMVVVNLYPFSKTVSKPDVEPEDARGYIDIGGPCMLRAASKNYLRVLAVSRPADYRAVLDELKEHQGTVSLETRFTFARQGFRTTAEYDREVAAFLDTVENDRLRNSFTIHSG